MGKLKRPPVFREDGTIEIRLTRGYVAIIDAVDAEQAQFNWHVLYWSESLVYAKRGVGTRADRRTVLLHREILGATLGEEVDHTDGDGLNNRRANLRIVSATANQRNSGVQSNNASGYRGVSFNRQRQKWVAYLGVGGKTLQLGCFNTPEEANAVRLKAEREQWGVEQRRREAHGES